MRASVIQQPTDSLLVIFGAGATYDSVEEHARTHGNTQQDWRPPLATELFAPRKTTFEKVIQQLPSAQAIVPEMRRKVAQGANIEDELQRLQDEAESGDTYKRRLLLAIQFYLQDVLYQSGTHWLGASDGQTHYAVLAHRLEVWRREKPGRSVTYLSFNYDTLLEAALRPIITIGPRFDDYIANMETLVFKVHGSVDWAYRVEPEDPAIAGEKDRRQRLIDWAGQADPGRAIELVEGPPWGKMPDGGSYLAALAIPTTRKSSLVLPPQHEKVLQAALRVRHEITGFTPGGA